MLGGLCSGRSLELEVSFAGVSFSLLSTESERSMLVRNVMIPDNKA